jgi:hypothetical protein
MIDFQLDNATMAMVGVVGLFRQIQNIQKNRKHAHGASDLYSWQMHIEGCMGEYCTAKYLGLFWDGKLGDLSAGDIGKIETRTAGGATGFEKGDIHKRRLCLHKEDEDNSPFVHVTGVNGFYLIHGWLYGHEGKKDEYWQDPTGNDRKAFFVDNDKLRSMVSLKELVDNSLFK